MKARRPNLSPRMHGMTAVLAMLFLVLFSAMALGFYSATRTSMQVASNDEKVGLARAATESGMEFMKYQLAHVNIPANITDVDAVANDLFSNLQTELDGTGNMGTMTLSKTGGGGILPVIYVPGSNGQIKLDANGDATFRGTITVTPDGVVVKTDGYYGNTAGSTRAIQMEFSRQQHTTSVFDYAVASKGQVVVTKGSITGATGIDPKIATVMSALPSGTSVSVSATVGGDVSVVAGGTASISGGANVGGSTNLTDIMNNHVHEVGDPEFPTIDTTVYKQYATNTYSAGVPLKNLLIPAGTSKKFTGNQTIQGIMYIVAPCSIQFSGNVNLQGFIVVEGGAPGNNYLEFTGNLTMSPVPNQPEFDALRTNTGVAILGPDTNVKMTGSGGGGVTGNLITKTFTFKGASDLVIDRGTIMTYSTGSSSFVMDSSKSVKFTATGAHNQPKIGLSYNTYYLPDPSSYQELTK